MDKILCTICVREASKGVKSKNTRNLVGVPLLAHSIIQAKASKLFDAISVSSDDLNALSIARKYGVDFVVERPKELATDTSSKPDAIKHCVEQVEKLSGKKFNYFVDLDATSPLRKVEDIIEAFNLLKKTGVSNIITGCMAHRSPYFNMVELNSSGFIQLCKTPNQSVCRRQDAPVCYDMNASIYVWNRESFFNGPNVINSDTKIYEMPVDRSIDIDSELDWLIVETIMNKKNNE